MSENGDTDNRDNQEAPRVDGGEGLGGAEETLMTQEEREAKAIREGRKAPANVESLFTLKVDNIPPTTTADFLRQEFGVFGEIGDIYIPKRFKTDILKGFAFVRYVKQSDLEEALKAMDSKQFDGHEIKCSEAMKRRPDNPKEAMASRGGGRGGRGDRGGRGSGRGSYHSDRDFRGGHRGDRGYDDRRGDYHRGGMGGGYDDYRGGGGGGHRGAYGRRDEYHGGGSGGRFGGGGGYDYPRGGGGGYPPSYSGDYGHGGSGGYHDDYSHGGYRGGGGGGGARGYGYDDYRSGPPSYPPHMGGGGGGYSGGAPAGGDYDRSYGGSRRSRSRSPGRDR